MNQLNEADLDELANTRPTLTYGNPTQPAPVEFVPAHVAFDKKVGGSIHTAKRFNNTLLVMVEESVGGYDYSGTSLL